MPYTNKRDIKVDNTPKRISQIDLSSDDDNVRPGTPSKEDGTNGQSPQWKSKISNIKKSIIGTPRFHRRKMIGTLISIPKYRYKYRMYYRDHFYKQSFYIIVNEPGNEDSTSTVAPDSPE